MLESMKASIVDGVDRAEEAADLDAQSQGLPSGNLTSKTTDRPPSVSKMAEQPVSRPTSKAEEREIPTAM